MLGVEALNKLVNMFNGYQITGRGSGTCFQLACSNSTRNIHRVLFEKAVPASLKGDLVVSSDVIEHLSQP